MKIIADHDHDYVVRMNCENCMVDTIVSTFSPYLSHYASMFAATHATCPTTGPDFESMVSDIIDLRTEAPTHVRFVGDVIANAERIAIEKRERTLTSG